MLRLSNKPHNGGAKDGEFEMSLGSSESMERVEPVARRGLARPKSLATARTVAGHFVRQRSSHRHHLASSRWSERRLSRLLLLPCGGGTQDQIDRDAIGDVDFADLAAARAPAAGDRRLPLPSGMGQKSKGRMSITTRHRARPTSRFCMAMFGSPCRWRGGILDGGR